METDAAIALSASHRATPGMGVETDAAEAPVSFAATVHASGRYLLDQAGNRWRFKSEFFWRALIFTTTELRAYFANRRARGFNSFEFWLIDRNTNGAGVTTPNALGDVPFTTPNDLSTPNDDYFDYVDVVLDIAEEYGFTAQMYVAYSGYGGADWHAVVATNTLGACQTYGTYVGNRYKNRRNVLFMALGDYSLPNDSTRAKHVAIFDAIRATGALNLMGAEGNDPDALPSEETYFTFGTDPSTSVLNINSAYCEGPKEGGGTGNGRDYDTIDRAVRLGAGPVYACETPQFVYAPRTPYYPINMSRSSTRKYQQWALTSGAVAGVNGGNTYVANPTDATMLFANIDAADADDAQHSHALWDSLQWENMRPSGTSGASPHTRTGATGSTNYCGRVLIVSGGGSGDSLITSCMSIDGTQLLAYVPPPIVDSTATVTFSVDFRSLAPGSYLVRWWNPTTGAFSNALGGASTVDNSLSAQSFTTPGDNGTGTNDWMLVVGNI